MQNRQKSLLNNSLFNFIKTFFRVTFPIITFTYAARCLGAEGIGQINFSRSIVSCFAMLAMLGMDQYGTREVAKRRYDREVLSKFTHEMLLINACTSIIAYVLFSLAVLLVPKLQGYTVLLLINSAVIPLQTLGMEWLYQGLEEYKYIALRSILFQFGALVALFLFVKDADDTAVYAAITLASSSGAYLINFFHARKYINVKYYGDYHLRQHLRPLMWLFAMAVSIELYTVLDSTMLGFLQGDAVVGRYTAAVKVNKTVNTLIMAANAVLIPRLSLYIGQGENDKVRALVEKAYNFVFLLSIPAAVGLFMLSDEVLLLFSGNGFRTAAVTMRILMPIILVIPFSTATNIQIFVPMKKEKLILYSTLAGAVTNLICNAILIPRYAENGAALATVAAESVVAIVCFVNAKKYFNMKDIFRQYYQYWLSALPIPFIVMAVKQLNINYVLQTVIAVVVAAGCYFALLLFQKNKYMKLIVQRIGKKRE